MQRALRRGVDERVPEAGGEAVGAGVFVASVGIEQDKNPAVRLFLAHSGFELLFHDRLKRALDREVDVIASNGRDIQISDFEALQGSKVQTSRYKLEI